MSETPATPPTGLDINQKIAIFLLGVVALFCICIPAWERGNTKIEAAERRKILDVEQIRVCEAGAGKVLYFGEFRGEIYLEGGPIRNSDGSVFCNTTL